jgi:hypothetical protein
MVIFVLFFVESFVFAASEPDNVSVVNQAGPKGCTELADRLDIENKSRGQFAGDIDFYKEAADEPKPKDLFQDKQGYF